MAKIEVKDILDTEFKKEIAKAVEHVENNEEFVYLNNNNSFAIVGKKENETVVIEKLIPKVL